ncbi:hypothetical protein TorRG33x02_018770, partial [Trema orientale]
YKFYKFSPAQRRLSPAKPPISTHRAVVFSNFGLNELSDFWYFSLKSERVCDWLVGIEGH